MFSVDIGVGYAELGGSDERKAMAVEGGIRRVNVIATFHGNTEGGHSSLSFHPHRNHFHMDPGEAFALIAKAFGGAIT